MTIRYDFGAGGFDISFTIPELAANDYIRIKCDSSFHLRDKNTDPHYGYIELKRTASGFEIAVLDMSEDDIERLALDDTEFLISEYANNARITVHNEFISFYFNGIWVNTFWLANVMHKEEPQVWLIGTATIVLTEIVYPELNDWRDAIFIDLEQTGMNAIGSIILSKPIDVYSKWDGSICFSMNAISDTVLMEQYVRRVSRSNQRNPQAASDGIVYFTDVAIVIDEQYLEDYGLSTKLIRLPDLDQGIRAAVKLQNKARKAQRQVEVQSRFDPSLEMKDILQVRTPFTSAENDDYGIALLNDSMKIELSDATFSMTVTGREEE